MAKCGAARGASLSKPRTLSPSSSSRAVLNGVRVRFRLGVVSATGVGFLFVPAAAPRGELSGLAESAGRVVFLMGVRNGMGEEDGTSGGAFEDEGARK